MSHDLEKKKLFGRPEVFLEEGVLKIYCKFTGEQPCRSLISKKLLFNFIEIELLHGCSPINLLHIFRTPFLKNTSGRLLLDIATLKLYRLCFLPKYSAQTKEIQ